VTAPTRLPTARHRRPTDSGSTALELVVLTPALLALLLLIVAAGRVTTATGLVDAATRDAARAASLERSLPVAAAAARSTAAASLAGQDVRCRDLTVEVNGDYAAPVGVPAMVHVRVRCTVDLSDVALPGLPGAKTMSVNYTSVLDRYRGKALGFANSEAASSANRSTGGA
jgi:Flp pilus assembly protein TadG